MMPSIGPLEIVIVLVIALLILGPKKLPEMGRSVGKGMREFKNSVSGDNDEPEPEELAIPSKSTATSEPVAPPPVKAVN